MDVAKLEIACAILIHEYVRMLDDLDRFSLKAMTMECNVSAETRIAKEGVFKAMEKMQSATKQVSRAA